MQAFPYIAPVITLTRTDAGTPLHCTCDHFVAHRCRHLFNFTRTNAGTCSILRAQMQALPYIAPPTLTCTDAGTCSILRARMQALVRFYAHGCRHLFDFTRTDAGICSILRAWMQALVWYDAHGCRHSFNFTRTDAGTRPILRARMQALPYTAPPTLTRTDVGEQQGELQARKEALAVRKTQLEAAVAAEEPALRCVFAQSISVPFSRYVWIRGLYA